MSFRIRPLSVDLAASGQTQHVPELDEEQGSDNIGDSHSRRRRRKGKTGESSRRFSAQGVTAEIPLTIPLPPIPRDESSGMSTGMGDPSLIGMSQGNHAVS